MYGEKLSHVNIIRLFEIIETFRSHIYLFMEYAGEELEDYMSKDGPFNEVDGKHIFGQIVSAVDYMHQFDVIHRDLKAENVLFASKYHAKVGDFGFSTVVTNGALLDIFCGSPPYAVPELFREEKYDSMQVDICMGSGCHAILHDDWDHPFKGDTIDDVVPKIESVDYEIPKGLSVESISLMRGMLKYNFRLRYSGRAVDVIHSLWLTSITNKVIEVATDDIEVVDITREPVIALNNNDWNASQQATTEILQLMKE